MLNWTWAEICVVDAASKARGEYLRTHFKNMREVAAALTGKGIFSVNVNLDWNVSLGMKLNKAYSYLSDVKEHKRVIPFRRFAGGVGRTGQAKEFKTTQGECYRVDDLDFIHWY